MLDKVRKAYEKVADGARSTKAKYDKVAGFAKRTKGRYDRIVNGLDKLTTGAVEFSAPLITHAQEQRKSNARMEKLSLEMRATEDAFAREIQRLQARELPDGYELSCEEAEDVEVRNYGGVIEILEPTTGGLNSKRGYFFNPASRAVFCYEEN